MAFTDKDIDKFATFKIYPSNLITSDFTNVKIISIGGWESVPFIKPAEKHAIVYSTLPDGTPNDYRAYKWVMLRLENGDITAIGLPWIDESTVKINSNTDVVITVHSAGGDDVPFLRKVLAAHGYHDVEIAVQNTSS